MKINIGKDEFPKYLIPLLPLVWVLQTIIILCFIPFFPFILIIAALTGHSISFSLGNKD